MKHQEKELVPGQVYYLDNMKEDWGIFKEVKKLGRTGYYMINKKDALANFAFF
jgi:hypothetical protein